MADHVAKVVEVVGTSGDSIEKAIEVAIARTSETVRNLQWFEVAELRGHIVDGKVDRYQVLLKIGFGLEG